MYTPYIFIFVWVIHFSYFSITTKYGYLCPHLLILIPISKIAKSSFQRGKVLILQLKTSTTIISQTSHLTLLGILSGRRLCSLASLIWNSVSHFYVCCCSQVTATWLYALCSCSLRLRCGNEQNLFIEIWFHWFHPCTIYFKWFIQKLWMIIYKG